MATTSVDHQDLYMVAGDGETSYAKNSRLQKKVFLETRPVLKKAIREAYTSLHLHTMVVVDLGCSSGPNTLRFISEVIDAISRHCDELNQTRDHMQLQFFLNDLPGNDFNNLFRLLEQFKATKAKKDMGEPLPPYYISGLPGSFYTRLFPCRNVHLFHSLFCLHWLTQVPEGLDGMRKAPQDEENIYITNMSSLSVVKLYQRQFKKDFSLFLKLRYEELVFGGQMVLTFIGRKNKDALFSGDSNHHFYKLLAQSMQSLVDKDLVQRKKLESFYIPLYSPSVGEVEDLVKQCGLFDITHLQLFTANWDPYDEDIESNIVLDSVQSGANVSKCVRAVMEPLVASHFGDNILDMLFTEYAHRVGNHLAVEKTKHAIILISLKKAI